jgi:hypothetical protein
MSAHEMDSGLTHHVTALGSHALVHVRRGGGELMIREAASRHVLALCGLPCGSASIS